MLRIALAGIQHETNTYSSELAGLDAFTLGGGWPGTQIGGQIAKVLGGMNLPIGGALGALKADPAVGPQGVLPVLWTAATPSGRVTDEAFEVLSKQIVEGICALHDAEGLDGLYLDLHGAMVTQSYDDGEGELLRRLRTALGASFPIVASLDMHANVSAVMVDLADVLVGYRTYPHVDMRETGIRAAGLLVQRIMSGKRQRCYFRQVAYVAPLTAQTTLAEPAATLAAQLQALEAQYAKRGVVSASWTTGFPLAQIADAAQCVLVYSEDSQEGIAAARDMADHFTASLIAARDEFNVTPLAPSDAVDQAMKIAATAHRPVILADANDNPGGGGASDTVTLLRTLVEKGARRAIVAIVCDPQAASIVHRHRVGEVVTLSLGGKAMASGCAPYLSAFAIEVLTNGQFTGSGPMWGGTPIDLGPMALLRVVDSNGLSTDVRVIVSTRKMQAADQSIFLHVGVLPVEIGILVLKSAVHFRADFGAIAEAVLVVDGPGACAAR